MALSSYENRSIIIFSFFYDLISFSRDYLILIIYLDRTEHFSDKNITISFGFSFVSNPCCARLFSNFPLIDIPIIDRPVNRCSDNAGSAVLQTVLRCSTVRFTKYV